MNAGSTHDISRETTDTESMDTSLHSQTHQPSIPSASCTRVVSQSSSIDQLVLDQSLQLKIMLPYFWVQGRRSQHSRSIWPQRWGIEKKEIQRDTEYSREDPTATANFIFKDNL